MGITPSESEIKKKYAWLRYRNAVVDLHGIGESKRNLQRTLDVMYEETPLSKDEREL